MSLTKRQITALGHCFSAEIDSAMTDSALRGLVQSKAKVFAELAEQGLVEHIEVKSKAGPFMATFAGWVLTEAGRMAYCEWAAEEAEVQP